jgi:hypothetical protein
MSDAVPNLMMSPQPVLLVQIQGRSVAVPQAAVAAIATLEATPPLPLAQPWVGGLVAFPQGPHLLVELFGSEAPTTVRRLVTAIALALPGSVPLALCADGAGILDQVTPLAVVGGRASVACPASWLRPGRRANGQEVLILQLAALADSLREAA